jgi:broad specificity phosphatase PhoE
MRIFLIRHGQSKLNAVNIHQSKDTKLSEYGIEQVEKLAKRFNKINVDIIIASKYVRVMHTAQIIGRALKKRVIYTELLNEWRAPSEIEGTAHDDKIAVRIQNERVKHLKDKDWHYSDEENFYDLRDRVNKVIKYLQARKEESIIVVSHGDVIRMICAIALFGNNIKGSEFRKFRKIFRLNNTAVTEVEIVDNVWKVITFGEYAHLK